MGGFALGLEFPDLQTMSMLVARQQAVGLSLKSFGKDDLGGSFPAGTVPRTVLPLSLFESTKRHGSH